MGKIRKLIIEDITSRGLNDLKRRLSALDKIEAMIQQSYPLYIETPDALRDVDKDEFKHKISTKKGRRLNGAENSVINEIYYRINPQTYTKKIKSR